MMLNLRTLLLIALGLCVSIDAMGFVVDASYRARRRPHHYGSYDDGDKDCEQANPTKQPTTEAAPTTTTATPTTTTAAVPTCPEGSIMVHREPTVNNSYTSIWCLQAFVQADKFVSSQANAQCASKNGGVLSAFESKEELVLVQAQAAAQFEALGIKMGSITIDGRRKAECMANSTFKTPECTKYLSFELIDKHTDPTFTFTNWYSGQPDGNNVVIDGVYNVESCILLYLTANTYPKYDGLYNDMYCDFAVSPTNSGQIYSSYGYVCGWEPRTGVWKAEE